MAILPPGRKGTAGTLPRRRTYRQDFLHAFIELDNRKGRRVKTKRQVRAQFKKNAELIPIPLGARHKMGFNKAVASLVERKLIDHAGGENDPISWTAKGKEQLHAARAALAFHPGSREELSQDQLISIAQMLDRSSSGTNTTRCTKTNAQFKLKFEQVCSENSELLSQNKELWELVSRLQQELREHKTALISARKEILHLKIESVERDFHGPLTPDPDDVFVHPGGVEYIDFDPVHPSPVIGSIVVNEASAPSTPPVPREPSPSIFAPRPVRPSCILPSGSWIHPLSKQPSPAPTQFPGDEHEHEYEIEGGGKTTDVAMVLVDGSDDDDDDDEEEGRSRNDAAGQLPTPDHTPARPVRSRSHRHSLVLPTTPQVDLELQEELAQSKKEVAELTDQLEQKSNDVSVLESQLSARDKEVESIQGQLRAEIQSLQRVKKTNQRRLATIAWVKGKNLDLHKQKLRLKRRIRELEDEMERKRGVLERMFMEYNREGPPKKRKRVSI